MQTIILCKWSLRKRQHFSFRVVHLTLSLNRKSIMVSNGMTVQGSADHMRTVRVTSENYRKITKSPFFKFCRKIKKGLLSLSSISLRTIFIYLIRQGCTDCLLSGSWSESCCRECLSNALCGSQAGFNALHDKLDKMGKWALKMRQKTGLKKKRLYGRM